MDFARSLFVAAVAVLTSFAPSLLHANGVAGSDAAAEVLLQREAQPAQITAETLLLDRHERWAAGLAAWLDQSGTLFVAMGIAREQVSTGRR